MGALHPRVSFVFLGNSKLSSLWHRHSVWPRTNPGIVPWYDPVNVMRYVNGPSQPQPQPPKKNIWQSNNGKNHPFIIIHTWFSVFHTSMDFQSLVAQRASLPIALTAPTSRQGRPGTPGGSQPRGSAQRLRDILMFTKDRDCYPLWWTNILLWKMTIFNGKIHYFYGHFQ